MADKQHFQAPSWNKIYHMLLKQADRICLSGFKPDLIVGVSRGGWIPARVLSDLLDNRNLAAARVELYLGIDTTYEEPMLSQPVSADVVDKRVLIVDEIVDSGRSLQLVTKHIFERGAAEVKTATVYRKPWSRIQPDYCEETTTAWIIFPWDVRENLRKIYDPWKNNPLQLKEHVAEFVNAGVPKQLVAKLLKYFEEETC